MTGVIMSKFSVGDEVYFFHITKEEGFPYKITLHKNIIDEVLCEGNKFSYVVNEWWYYSEKDVFASQAEAFANLITSVELIEHE